MHLFPQAESLNAAEEEVALQTMFPVVDHSCFLCCHIVWLTKHLFFFLYIFKYAHHLAQLSRVMDVHLTVSLLVFFMTVS